MTKEIKRTDSDIDKLLDDCSDATLQGLSAYPGLTFEQGVAAGIEWLIGYTEEHPLEE